MKKERVLALGFFDGVHIGHGALLTRAKSIADGCAAEAGVVCFDLHPDILVKGEAVPLITSFSEQQRLIRTYYGISHIVRLHFDRALMQMPWKRFAEELLFTEFGAVCLVCGQDYRFGYRGEGNARLLAQLCAEKGVGCEIVDPVRLDGVTVSSTHIRSLLQNGEVETAAAFLGHPFSLSGRVESGKKLGRTLGIPTANLPVEAGLLCPRFGVYAALVYVDGKAWKAVTNIGTRPTVNGQSVTVESWLLDFDGELYGKEIRVELYRFLRPERKFESLEALRAEILNNAASAREYLEVRLRG